MSRGQSAILAFLFAVGCGGDVAPRRLLLITVDTLRADRLGAYGSASELTPNLDALARESQRFTAAYAPASHTLPSVAALLTGLFPQQLGIWSNESRLPANASTLAGEFSDRGFFTAAVVSNWVLRRDAGLASGFDRYDDRMPELEATRPMPERIARDTTDAALAMMEACSDRGGRCMLWVHYQDPHGPYTPPADLRERRLAVERRAPGGDRRLPALAGSFGFGGIPDYQLLEGRRDVAFYRAGYDGEVAHADAEIGRLLEAARSRPAWRRTVVVFAADHGESLGEDDYWFAHGALLSDPLVRVPLLIRIPGRPPAERSDPVSLVDLRPTLEALFFASPPAEGVPGRDLFADEGARGQSVPYLATLGGSKVPRFGLVQGEFKYLVVLRDGVWQGRLLQRDAEDVDLTAPAPQVAARMRRRLEEVLERYPAAPELASGSLDEQERARLRALGYLGAGDDEP
jgi:arylsulfatase